ncbi:ROK family protein [Actinokineospora sp. HUAS TT18]|uniref:ROK family protein n=1 Tax=Actinokineospora sp. HUAS TT18 TaxID=3447451 RepID=UPI003F52330F
MEDGASRASIRRANLGLALRHLRAGARSRTRLAQDMGLPKATVTMLVAELVERGLVREGEVARAGMIGRPPLELELDGRGLCGLGVEISVDYVRAVALGLAGEELLDQWVTIDRPHDHGPVLDTAADLIRDVIASLADMGREPVGVTIAAPGEIDRESGTVVFAPNMGWSGVGVVDGIVARLGSSAPPVSIDNDARLGTVAEYAFASAEGVRDLVYVRGEVGIGCGIVAGGKLVVGSTGFAGEMGHVRINPEPVRCACGRLGCWETMIGFTALLNQVADPGDPLFDNTRDLEERLAEIATRARAGDERTLAALDRVGADLGLGLGMLITVLDPAVIVLGGYFAHLGDYLIDRVHSAIDETVVAPRVGRCDVRLSKLGFTSAARGAAQAVVDEVFQDPAAANGHR